MQAPQLEPQSSALVSFFPALVQWALQALGFAAVLLVITQNVDLDFTAKEIHTKLHYRGNVLVDMAKEKDK
jgi:hypothetical protein